MINQREFVIRDHHEGRVIASAETEALTVSYIKNILFSMKGLKHLSIRDGRLGQESFLSLLAGLEYNQNLTRINFRNNWIYLDAPKMEFALAKFKELPSLRKVDLSLNFISQDAQSYLSETKSQGWSLFSIFKRKQVPHLISDGSDLEQLSVISPGHVVSEHSWVISLVCKKGGSHAMIYLEGRGSKGQRFIERSHLILPEGSQLGRVVVTEVDPEDFDPEKYYSQNFTISKEQGEDFRMELQQNKGEGVPYCSYWSGVDYAYVNCIDWCLRELRKLGINLEKTFIPTPQNVVSGENCSIM